MYHVGWLLVVIVSRWRYDDVCSRFLTPTPALTPGLTLAHHQVTHHHYGYNELLVDVMRTMTMRRRQGLDIRQNQGQGQYLL